MNVFLAVLFRSWIVLSIIGIGLALLAIPGLALLYGLYLLVSWLAGVVS